jgi:hypothetical protein
MAVTLLACGVEVETLKLCERMEVKRDDKRSGRAVNDVDCRAVSKSW